eukprot:EG_transcript_69964
MAAVDRDASIEEPPDATPDNFSHAEPPPPPLFEAEAAVAPAAGPAPAELEVEATEEARWAAPHSNEQGAADPTATEAATPESLPEGPQPTALKPFDSLT